jgi:hypothetical protein
MPEDSLFRIGNRSPGLDVTGQAQHLILYQASQRRAAKPV